MTAHTLRPATLDDIAAITAIYEYEVLNATATYELTPPDQMEMRRRFSAMFDAGYPTLVAENRHGAVDGYAYANAFRARPAYRWAVEDSIYLSPDARGQGLGRALLTRLVDDSRDLGFRQMIAVIGGADNHGSIKVHERAGFRMVGTFEASGFKFGRWIDTVMMQMALGAGGTTVPNEAVFPGTLT